MVEAATPSESLQLVAKIFFGDRTLNEAKAWFLCNRL